MVNKIVIKKAYLKSENFYATVEVDGQTIEFVKIEEVFINLGLTQ